MGTHSQERTSAFKGHFIGCVYCAAVLQGAIEYVTAMRAAAQELRLRAGVPGAPQVIL